MLFTAPSYGLFIDHFLFQMAESFDGAHGSGGPNEHGRAILPQFQVGGQLVGTGISQVRAGLSQSRAGGPQFTSSVPQVRPGNPQIGPGCSLLRVGGPKFKPGIPQIRDGRFDLGSARFAVRPPWIGPPYTQVAIPAFKFLSSSEKSGKRKTQAYPGEYIVHLGFIESFC